MEAREDNPLSTRRSPALRRVLLMRFAPALIIVAGVAGYGWYYEVPHMLLPWSFMVWGIASAAYTTVKHYRSEDSRIDFEDDTTVVPDRTPWLTVLAIGMGYLMYFFVSSHNPWAAIAALGIEIRRAIFE